MPVVPYSGGTRGTFIRCTFIRSMSRIKLISMESSNSGGRLTSADSENVEHLEPVATRRVADQPDWWRDRLAEIDRRYSLAN